MLRTKPSGVDLLGMVMLINGMFAFFTGLDSLGFAAFLATLLPINTAVPGFLGATAGFLAVWGSILFVLGIASFIVAFGLFGGKRWAWSGAMALAIIGIVIPIINILAGYWPSIFTLLLSALIIYYLTRQEVRAYFGRRISAASDAAAA